MFTLVFLLSAIAGAQTLEDHLRQQLENKTLIIREFYTAGNLNYNYQGILIGKSRTGSWTVAGLCDPQVRIANNQLHIEGQRIGQVFDVKRDELTARRLLGRVQIRIDLPPGAGTEQLDVILQKVFIQHADDLITQVPPYWKGYFEKRRDLAYVPPWSEAVYKVAEGVSPPRVISAPHPDYSNVAPNLSFEGTSVFRVLVGKDGKVHDMVVMRPVGLGVDEKVAEAIAKWKFRPAMKGGEPVPVAVNIEVNFRDR